MENFIFCAVLSGTFLEVRDSECQLQYMNKCKNFHEKYFHYSSVYHASVYHEYLKHKVNNAETSRMLPLRPE